MESYSLLLGSAELMLNGSYETHLGHDSPYREFDSGLRGQRTTPVNLALPIPVSNATILPF
eukprot:4298-Eustigmatos_ZCMA.PRE.1